MIWNVPRSRRGTTSKIRPSSKTRTHQSRHWRKNCKRTPNFKGDMSLTRSVLKKTRCLLNRLWWWEQWRSFVIRCLNSQNKSPSSHRSSSRMRTNRTQKKRKRNENGGPSWMRDLEDRATAVPRVCSWLLPNADCNSTAHAITGP